MEKTKSFNEVVAFIKKAMLNDLIVTGYHYTHHDSSNRFHDYYYFGIINEEKKLHVTINIDEQWSIGISRCGEDYAIGCLKFNLELSERESLELKELCLDVKEYYTNKTLKFFDNFFPEPTYKSHLTLDIDELTDDEEE